MDSISTLLAMLLSSLWGAPAAAQRAPLIWRWDPGTRTSYRLTEHMDQTITGQAKTRIRWVREIGFSDEVVSNTPDGAAVRRAFEYAVIEAEHAGRHGALASTLRHDTRTPPADPKLTGHPMVAPFIALAGMAVEFTVDDEGRVSEVTGSEAALDAMYNALLGPLGAGTLQQGLSGFVQDSREDLLAEQFRQAFRLIPGRLVRRGESWDIPISHVSPLAGSLTSTTTATLDTFDRRRRSAHISLEGTLSLDDSEGPGFAGLVGITLESGSISGSVVFDTADRVIDNTDVTMRTVWSAGESSSIADVPWFRQELVQRARLERRENAAVQTTP